MDNETRERVISNEDRLMEEVNKQAKVIQWYEKENRHNQEIIIKDCKEIEELKRKIAIKDKWCQLIWDIGCDYDGYNDVDNLKKIIDELEKEVEASTNVLDALKNKEQEILWVAKKDYDRVVEENNRKEEELARYKYLIDLAMQRRS